MRKEPTDYASIANKRGFEWLGPVVQNATTKTKWKCEHYHEWLSTYHAIRRGDGCPICANILAKRPQDYRDLAANRDFAWIGPTVPNVMTKTEWRCQYGHQWQAWYSAIQQGNGCPICSNRQPKSKTDYHLQAESRGFRWLGPEVPSTTHKTTWFCTHGHSWQSSYQSIQNGNGCHYCSKRVRKTTKHYHDLANKRGLRWLGPEVPNVTTKTSWECQNRHRWQAKYNNIENGTGCPECLDLVNGAIASQVQRDLHGMIGGVLNLPFERYKIDIALDVDSNKIAVEYDSWYWHGNKSDFDERRDSALISAGWKIIRVKSNSLLPTADQLRDAISDILLGKDRVEIVLGDWGIGRSRFE